MKRSISPASWTTTAFLMIGSSLPLCAGEPVLEKRFDDLEPGEPPPELAYRQEVAEGSLHVVSAETDPADPFGKEANRSLYAEDHQTGARPRFCWASASPLRERVRFKLRFFMPEAAGDDANGGPAVVRILVGERRKTDEGRAVAAVDGGLNLVLREDGKMKYDTGDNRRSLNQSFPRGVAHELVIELDLEKQEWRGELDGVELTDKGGRLAAFPFQGKAKQIDAVELLVGRGSKAGEHVFFDDLRLEAVSQASDGSSD